MERQSASTFTTNDTSSSEAVYARRGPEFRNEGSHTTCFLPSPRVSISSDEATPAFGEERAASDETNTTSRGSSLSSHSNIHNYQPLTSHAAGVLEASYGRAVNVPENVEHPSPASGALWRPTYLRRRILAAFSVVFVVIITALQVLSVVSNRNDGIAKGFNKDHYLWTYGPTAFLTLIAALFNRVEYQAKAMAPWERLSKHPAPARKTLLLDYVSPLQPVAIYQSLRNKDFAVSATTTISVLIKLLIVWSSGLITLSRVGVHRDSMPMVVQDAFVDDDSLLQAGAGNSVPYFMLQGLTEGSSYPPGISDRLAFQSVQSQLPDTAEYQVVVDGLATSLQCQIAKLVMTNAEAVGMDYGQSIVTFNITSPGCNMVLANLKGPGLTSGDWPYQLAFGRFEPVQCDGSKDDEGKRVLIMFGLQEWFVDETIPTEKVNIFSCMGDECVITTNVRGKLLQSAQLLCASTYEIAKFNVIQNGTEVQSIVPAYSRHGEVANRTLDHVSPWSFMKSYVAAFHPVMNGRDVWQVFNVSQKSFVLDKYMYSLLESQAINEINASSLFDPKFVQSIATTYHQQVGAIIAKRLLMEPSPLNTTGSAIIMDDRLIVRKWTIEWMTSLVALCLVLSIFTTFVIPPNGILPRSPSTLPGIAVLVARSPDLLGWLHCSGDATSKALHLQLEGSKFRSEAIQDASSGLDHGQQYFVIKDATGKVLRRFHQSESTHSHPWILHPASRLGLGFILLALSVTLEVTLHQSSSHDGLGDVSDNGYVHYTWTSLPAIVFGGLAIMLSSIDFSIRSLAPYTSLRNIVTIDAFRTLDFLDMSVPSAIIEEAKLRNIGALATTTTLLVASFFTIFAGSLFQGVSFSTTTTALLRANNSFGPIYNDTSFGVEAPLILLSNLSYPTFTYEDFAFPQFLPTVALAPSKFSNTSLLSINAVVPALRSRLNCRLYDKEMIRVQFKSTYESAQTGVPDKGFLTIISDEEDCLAGSDHWLFNSQFEINSDTSYFGVDTIGSSLPSNTYFAHFSGCSDFLYIWGKVNLSAESKVEHVAAMGCNQSIEAVDVETRFVGADLAIDMENPPHPVPNTERNSTASLDSGFGRASLYYGMPNIPTDELLSNTFALLTQSRWAIPLSMLGGGSDEAVADAIKFQHGVFLAQALNKVRAPAAETNTTLTHEQALEGDNDARRTFEATVVDNAGQQRVVQDAISTRVLEALLLVSVVLLGVGWVWLPATNVLPKRSPTTIASAVALLAGGNLSEWVDEIDSDASGAFGATTRFWMGWGNVPDEEGILMGNESENGISRFGIFAVKATHIDDKKFGRGRSTSNS